ncbi:hypothetical protein T439DRAFT_149899 [Meredithblackwellia eburnea MCA 4105]
MARASTSSLTCLCRRDTVKAAKQATARKYVSPAYKDVQTPTNQVAPSPKSTATLLRDTRSLLRRYPVLAHTTWSSRIDQSLADLTSVRNARITIAGEAESGTSSLVNSVFDDPLSTDPELSVGLASRRLGKSPPEAIPLRYADRTSVSPLEVGIPSRWLRDNQADVVEIVYSAVGPNQSSLDSLHLSDAVVLVVSEVRLLSPPVLRDLLLDLGEKPNLIIALNVDDPSHSSALRTLDSQLSALLPRSSAPRVTVISTGLAERGLEALNPTEPGHEVSYENFQTLYIGSGMPAFQDAIARAVAGLRVAAENSTAPSVLQEVTADYVLAKALSSMAFAGAKIGDDLLRASADIAKLDYVAKDAERKVLEELDAVDGTLQVSSEDASAAAAALDRLFEDRLVWWKLPVRTDDLVTEIEAVVDQTYLRKFEEALVFYTGRLIGVSAAMTRHTDNLLSTPAFSQTSAATSPLSSLYSPILLNRIQQAKFESSKISSSDLSQPLITRRRQITAPGGPAEVLQSRAQSGVLTSFTLSTASIAGAIASEIAGFAELATNVGAGLFGTVFAGWLLQRRWAKARRSFFVDVEKRITGGLEDDLGVAAQALVDRSLYSARTAVVGATELYTKRQSGFDLFADDLTALDSRRRAFQ